MKRMQALICLAVMLMAAACTAARASVPRAGTVTGRIVLEGGPISPGGKQPGTRRIPGTVRFTGGHRRPVTVHTGTGKFSVRLPAGRYHVSDRSPRWLLVAANGTSRQTWSIPVLVTVTAHHTTKITLAYIAP